MKYKFYIFLLPLFLLVSCWSDDVQETKKEKKNFFVDTVFLWSESDSLHLEKTGRVSSRQDISISSNASGRISSVNVKAWDTVKKWQVLARLSDTIWSYGTNVQRASIGVERAGINYESTKLSLEKQVFDAQKNLEKLERNLVTLKADTEKNLAQAEDTLKNSEYANLWSKAALQIQQLDNNIAKAELDYQTKLIADTQQINTIQASTKKEFTNIRGLIREVITTSDEILWITPENRDKNDKFEDFLGANDKNQKLQAGYQLQKLIDIFEGQEYQNILSLTRNESLSQSDVSKVLSFSETLYNEMISTLLELETTINNSIESVGSLGSAEKTTFLTKINGLQSQLQAWYGAFIAFKSNALSFLETYKNNQASIQKAIDLQKKDRDIQIKNLSSGELSAQTGYDRTLLSANDRIQDLEDQIDIARNALENAKKNKDITLRSLKNSISDAKVWYSSAAKEYGKLTITSPISGTVSRVSIDLGQEVNMRQPLVQIVSEGTPEVQISLSKNEKDFISLGQKVTLISENGDEREWKVYSLADVADENLNYISTIIFDDASSLLWSIIQVKIPVNSGKTLLPVNSIVSKWDNIWFIKTLSGSQIADVRVRLWEIYGEYIEVVSCAKNCSDLEVITSDVWNYDENKYVIQKNNG